MEQITFNNWQTLDLRVGHIKKVEDHSNADKLYVLTVDVGNDEPITIVTSLKEYYTAEQLQDKRIIVLVNLQPATFRGVESHGMLLAAEKDGKCILLEPDADIEAGATIK